MQFVLLIGYGASIAKPNTIGRTLVHFEFSERHFNAKSEQLKHTCNFTRKGFV
jgi:hypothetical protein